MWDVLKNVAQAIRTQAKRQAVECLETLSKISAPLDKADGLPETAAKVQPELRHNPRHNQPPGLDTPPQTTDSDEPCWIRTSDPLLKRQMLYQLS